MVIGYNKKYSNVEIVPNLYYKPKPAFVIRQGKGEKEGFGITEYEVFIKQEKNVFDFFTIKNSYMEIEYVDGNSESIELIDISLTEYVQYYQREIEVDGEIVLYGERSFQKYVKNISLKVIYNDGTVHEGDLWPFDNYHTKITY